jgi:rhodanese-related sulfurtransferase
MRRLLFVLSLSFFFVMAFLQIPAESQEPKDILSIEAYDMLNTVPDTYLIDVRTRAEYQFVGHAPMAHLFPLYFMSDQLVQKDEQWEYQLTNNNKLFVEEISKKFQKANNLLIISRDGSRSILAARQLIKAGFKNVYNVKDGFEGAPFPTYEDQNKDKFYRQLAKRNKIPAYNHRRFYGWQWWGLPWTYDIDPKYIYPPDTVVKEKK